MGIHGFDAVESIGSCRGSSPRVLRNYPTAAVAYVAQYKLQVLVIFPPHKTLTKLILQGCQKILAIARCDRTLGIPTTCGCRYPPYA
ncbi:hypothetical protein LshimejAT787_1105320 [Lyophyllum shimeji]|uniref:Uncharacterized protein n=1 Tax=Lyophyllum shimeji TaxID=47721 RepID=A0A9P3PTF4_LYOSH|nr:hypothetical protein LshimejAT787_1105320 [Lyophyllum shimeji]